MSKNNLIAAWGNQEKRKLFLEAYEDWGVWLTIPELCLTFYRYQLPDETYIIAMKHRQHMYVGFKKEKWGFGVRYYVQRAGEHFTPSSYSSLWVVADLLKNAKVSLQKEAKERSENADTEFRVNAKVQVRGEVKYGNDWFDVDTEGVIVDIQKNGMLITLDRIDGDALATCFVRSKCISRLT